MPTPSPSDLLRHIRRLASTDEAASDRDLLHRFWVRHDEGAFAALVHRHGAMVFCVARRVLHVDADAEDVFQAAFLVLARKAGSVAWRQSIGAWLHGVAYRLALEARAAAARRHQREGQAPHRPPTDPLAEITVREAQAILDEELARLPERLRAPLVLCYLQGATRDEAARRLDLSLGTFKRRLGRGRALLQQRLVRRGLALSPVLLTALVTPSEVPARAADAVVRAAALEAAGASGVGAVSAGAAALARTAALLSRAKAVAALLTVAGALVAAGVGLAVRGRAGPPPSQQGAAAKPARPARGADVSEDGERPPSARALPRGAVARLGTTGLRHHGPVFALVYSADGKVLASAGQDGLRLWNVADGHLLKHFAAEGVISGSPARQASHVVALAPDGKTVAGSAADYALRVWDVATGKEVRKLEPFSSGVACAAFSPDGKALAAGSASGDLRVWDTATGKVLAKPDEPGRPMRLVDFTPDGKTLIVHAGAEVMLRDWPGGKEKARYAVYGPPALSPDRRLVAYGPADPRGGPLFVCDLRTGKKKAQLQGHEGGFLGVAVAPGGKVLASASLDNTLRLWDATTKKELRRLPGQSDWDILPMAFSPDGKVLAAGSGEGQIRLWDVATGKPFERPGEHARYPVAAAFSPDGRTLASLDAEGQVRLWDPLGGQMRLRFGAAAPFLRGRLGYPGTLALAPDGKVLLQGYGGGAGARLWDLDGKELRRLDGGVGLFSPDGRVLAVVGAENHFQATLALCEPLTGKLRARLTVPEGTVLALGFSPDGKLLRAGQVDGRGGFLVSWDMGTGKLRGHPLRLPDGCACVALSPDGRTAVVSDLRQSGHRFYDITSGRLTHRIAGGAFRFSPDGHLLAARGGDGSAIQVWEVATGQERCRFEGHEQPVSSLAFRPDGRLLASTSSDGSVLVWDVTGRLRRGRLERAELKPEVLAGLWSDLGKDARAAHKAVWALVAGGKAVVSFLAERLEPVTFDAARLPALVAGLDSDELEEREKATAELARLGGLAEPALRKALADRPPLEMRRRLETLLKRIEQNRPPAEWLRAWRSIEVLEQVGSSDARAALRKLAGGAPESELTRATADALSRMAR